MSKRILEIFAVDQPRDIGRIARIETQDRAIRSHRLQYKNSQKKTPPGRPGGV